MWNCLKANRNISGIGWNWRNFGSNMSWKKKNTRLPSVLVCLQAGRHPTRRALGIALDVFAAAWNPHHPGLWWTKTNLKTNTEVLFLFFFFSPDLYTWQINNTRTKRPGHPLAQEALIWDGWQAPNFRKMLAPHHQVAFWMALMQLSWRILQRSLPDLYWLKDFIFRSHLFWIIIDLLHTFATTDSRRILSVMACRGTEGSAAGGPDLHGRLSGGFAEIRWGFGCGGSSASASGRVYIIWHREL